MVQKWKFITHIKNLISGLSHLDFTLVGIYEELNTTITGGLHMNFLEVIGRNQVSIIPLNVTGEITVGCFLNGSHVYDRNKENLVGYELEVDSEMGTWLSWKVMEIINRRHGYTDEPFLTLVTMPLHDSSGNCFPRREVWEQEGLHRILPCGHVYGWCTCNEK